MRRAAGLSPGVYYPRVDYQQRSDGSFYILVGRAWKRSADGPWADGDVCIRFSYLGHRFRVYLPKSAEEILTEAGVLDEFVEEMSKPPTGVAVLSGRYIGDRNKHSRSLHWGPSTGKQIYLANGADDVVYVVTLPWSVYSILRNSLPTLRQMEYVLAETCRVWQEVHEQGPAFKPTLLKTVDKVEL